MSKPKHDNKNAATEHSKKEGVPTPSPVEVGKNAVPHEYDPVGMAGEKAGILKEVEEDLGKDQKRSSTRNDRKEEHGK